MSVGFPHGKIDIDNRAGQLVVQLRDDLLRVQQFKAWLDTQPDGDLTALGYTSNEVAQLKSAFTDLDKLAQIYAGGATQSPAYDFRTFSKLLTGVV